MVVLEVVESGNRKSSEAMEVLFELDRDGSAGREGSLCCCREACQRGKDHAQWSGEGAAVERAEARSRSAERQV